MKAHYLFAIADNDDQRDPKSKEVLKAEFAKAKLPAEIEVYKGAMHGWCPPDSQAYNQELAEEGVGPAAEPVQDFAGVSDFSASMSGPCR